MESSSLQKRVESVVLSKNRASVTVLEGRLTKVCSLGSLRLLYLLRSDVPRTSRIFRPKLCNIFSVLSLSIFKYNPGETNNKFTTKSVLNLLLIISMQRYTDEFQKKATILLCTIRSLVMVRNQLPAQRGLPLVLERRVTHVE